MKSVEDLYQEIKSSVDNEDHDSTINRLETLLATYPGYAPAHAELASLYYQSADHDNALKHFEQAVQFDPDNTKFQKNLADFYYTVLSRAEEALEIYEQLLVSAPMDTEILLVAGNLLVSLNRFDEAQARYEALINLEPWRLDIQELIDKLNLRDQEQYSPGVEAMYQRAQAMVQNGEIEAAIQMLGEILKNSPDYALAHNDLGVLSYQTGEVQKALKHYEKAVALAPTNTTYVKNLAEYYLFVMGEIEKALELYVVILKDHPQDIEALMAAGNISEKFENFEDAKIFYEAILDAEPWHLEATERLSALGQGQSENVSESKLFTI